MTRAPTMSHRSLALALSAGVIAGALVMALLWSGEAGARVGGGDGIGILIEFLFRLCIHYPAVGIPVTLGVIGYFVWKSRGGSDLGAVGDDVVYRAHHVAPSPTAKHLAARVREVDANFSEPLFLDYAQLAYARLRERAARGSVVAVEEIIFGRVNIVDVRPTPTHLLETVEFLVNLTEVRGANRDQKLREERLTSRRATGVLSPGPERVQANACVGCGATADPDSTGRCTSRGAPLDISMTGVCSYCNARVSTGRFDWVLSRIEQGEVYRATTSPAAWRAGRWPTAAAERPATRSGRGWRGSWTRCRSGAWPAQPRGRRRSDRARRAAARCA